jgi:lysophospholipase L1-like esterase
MTKQAIPLLLLVILAAACTNSAKSDSSTGTPAPTSAATGTAGASAADRAIYIALGDSLSQGFGASDMGSTAFVPLVATHLGGDFFLMNLGHGGDTSTDLFDHGHFDEAISTIEERNRDNNDANDVKLVTLEIGGNDLLGVYFSLVVTGACPDLQTSLNKPQCVDALRSALDGFRPNLAKALDGLRDADPALRVLLLTLYNPFQHFPGVGELGELSLEGKAGTPFPEGLNDIISDVASGRDDVTVVDVYARFQGHSQEFISGDFIHPNDAGYQVMADAVIEALPGVGLR